jgi:hypothetical protein
MPDPIDTTIPEMVERVARAISAERWKRPEQFDMESESWRNAHRDMARAAIALCGTRDLVGQFQTFIRSFSKTEAIVRPHKSIWAIHVVGVAGEAIITRLYSSAAVALARKAEMAKILCHH